MLVFYALYHMPLKRQRWMIQKLYGNTFNTNWRILLFPVDKHPLFYRLVCLLTRLTRFATED